MDTQFDYGEAMQTGLRIPTGQVVRSAGWIYLLSDDDRLTDMLAAEWFTAHAAELPADVSSGSVQARWSARRAIRAARRQVDAWNVHAAELDTLRPVHGPTVPVDSVIEQPQTATADMVIAASCNPMGQARWSLALEHAGTAMLKAHGLPATRPDVWSRRHGQHVTRPDRVAFRGTARYTLPQPVRYGRSGMQEAATFTDPRTLHHHVVTDVPAWQTFSVAELLTADASPDRTSDVRHGWRGHRRITWKVASRTTDRHPARATARAARAATGATGKRGKAQGPWSLAVRSLPRAIARDTDAAARAAALESLLRTAAADGVLTFGTVTVTVVGNAEAIAHDGRAWPVREWCQRAALAGTDPAAI